MTTLTQISPDSLTIDPVAEFLPRLTPAEALALRNSIAAQGILQPVMVRRGTNAVVDGRHRLEAARALGLDTIPVIEADEAGFDAALSANLLRRHMTTSQRAALAVLLFDTIPGPTVRSRMQMAAARLNVSWAYAMTALRLRNRAGADALARVRDGELSLQSAMRETGASYARAARPAVAIAPDEIAPPTAPTTAPAPAPATPGNAMTQEQAAALPGIIAGAYTAYLAGGDVARFAADLQNANPAELFAFADFLIADGDVAAMRAA